MVYITNTGHSMLDLFPLRRPHELPSAKNGLECPFTDEGVPS